MSLKKLIPSKIPISLYIHLPWCEKKCPYCDFNININKSKGDEERLMIAIFYDIEDSLRYLNGRKFSSIYFGGGTPSLVSSKIIKKIINKLITLQIIQRDCEINFELNPKEVTKNYLAEIIDSGVNRVSLGIQSFDQSILNSLERNHDSHNSFNALDILSEFKSIEASIDLIYGIMNQSLSSFRSDLDTFCLYEINHLSLYQLTIEPNTIFYKKELFLPKEKEIERMEAIAKELLEQNGFKQYEVSSWSKPGYESQHNLNYWHFGDFLGVGPGSHSKISNDKKIVRYRKIKPLEGYFKNQKTTDLKTIGEDDLDLDIAMNLPRNKKGLRQRDLNIQLPMSFLEKYEKGISEGLLLKDKIGTTEKGYRFLNETIQLFF